MYEENPGCPPPSDPNVPLWRYMDFTKYVWTISTGQLFFAAAYLLDDPFECSLPPANVTATMKAIERSPFAHDNLNDLIDGASLLWRRLRKDSAINCWHMNDHESAAMWKLYTEAGKGIAIRSTFQRLVDSLRDFAERVYAGVVAYRNYDAERLELNSLIEPIMTKRTSFAHEQELRALIFRLNTTDMRNGPPGAGAGIYVPANLDVLIESVWVSPEVDDWQVELVKSVSRSYGMHKPVKRSPINAKPLW